MLTLRTARATRYHARYHEKLRVLANVGGILWYCCSLWDTTTESGLNVKTKSKTPAKAATAKKAPRPARTKTSAYDLAEHLRTPKEIAAYLAAWLQDAPDDTAGIARALGDIARAKGMSSVAKSAGLSRESLYKALSGDGNPSFATVLKVVRALGVRLHAVAA